MPLNGEAPKGCVCIYFEKCSCIPTMVFECMVCRAKPVRLTYGDLKEGGNIHVSRFSMVLPSIA
jgi:hypothetical protein